MCDIITVGIVRFPVNLSRNATTATTTTALLMKRRRTSVVLTRTRTCADRNDEWRAAYVLFEPKNTRATVETRRTAETLSLSEAQLLFKAVEICFM